MKYLALIVFAVAMAGCHHNQFDVSPEQVTQQLSSRHRGMPGGPPDLAHLPPGAVKHEQTFKKGDTLPDGSIADKDTKLVRIEMSAHGPGGSEEGKQIEMIDSKAGQRK
jgi:hypothetical protein